LVIEYDCMEKKMSDVDELAKLAEMRERGILTEEEFARAKARVLGSTSSPEFASAQADPLNSLHRSSHNRWIGGVCGGIAEATGTPAWLWRLTATALFLCHGAGLILYILMWIFLPSEESWRYSRAQMR
jgi:phage shock protein PspC (stress-responsive transcriptional regulator)